ncbi:copper amine oxidase N-terminal domain-containing protein [Ammoniphilus sp. 3BR4]|uniref:copper amine oxidase N-terminal domain-containing protein n=1 Tax=Ammoniphilus sp. 3BR4 TaxID=3158265 RepID=UPI0034652D93
MKNAIHLSLIGTLLFSGLASVHAEDVIVSEELSDKRSTPKPTHSIFINQIVRDYKPLNINGRTFVPLRSLFEDLQATVNWDGKTKSVTAKKESHTSKLVINSTIGYVNGIKKSLDVAPFIHKDRTMVPVRFVSEALGYKVHWDEKTSSVYVTAEDVQPQDPSGLTIKVNGQVVDFTKEGLQPYTYPMIQDDRVYFPKSIFEGFGYELGVLYHFPLSLYDPNNKENKIVIRYGSIEYIEGGKEKEEKAKALSEEEWPIHMGANHYMYPLEVIEKTFDLKASWDKPSGVITFD